MNKQLHTLLNDSFSHYKSRQLKKALNAAQIALEFGLNENGHAADLIDANLLLVRIYNTNGRYQNNFSFFEKAQYHVEEAEKLNSQLNDPNKAVTIKMFAGRIFINKKNFAKARQCLDEALALATQINNHEGVAGTMSLLSKLSILQNQVDQAVEWAQKALNWLEENIKTNHLQLWTDAWLYLSNAYLRKQDYSKSLEISQELLRGSRQGGHIEKEIFALRNIAVVCGVKSNYKIGMQYFLEALDKCKSIGYQELYAQLQVNIGTLYAHLYNYPEAIRRYKNVLHAHNNYLEDKNKLVIFNNLGNIYLSTHQPNSALEYFEKAYRLAQQLRIKAMQAHALAQLGRAKLQLNRLEEAKNDTITAQCLIDQLGNINGKQINLLNRAEIHFREGSLECAQKLTQKAIEAARLVKDDACEIRGYKHLSKVFKAKGDYKTALEYEEKYGKIQEAFAKEQYDRQFLDMEIRHAIKEKQKAIEVLTKENEYQALLLKKSDQIAAQNKELMRANEDLRQFAYVASHDLKEPIRMIGSFTQIIHKKTKDLLSEKDHQYFDFINGGVNRMNELLDGLLKYATVGNNDVSIEDVDMNDVMLVCMANLHILIDETGANITYDQLPTVQSNKSLLIQLFQNLTSNALKFTKEGSRPEIKIGSIDKDEEVILYVKDNGIGISPDAQQKIFEIFQRLHPRGSYEGTGIGLAICQKIVSRLGGKIWVESEPDNGATFFVSIPK